MKTDKNFKKRVVMCVLGVLVCGFSVGFFKRATLGVDPFQSFMGGLDALIPMEFGTLYVIANICLLLFSLFADKHYIGLATIINLSVLGYVAQYSHELMLAWFPELSLVGRFIFLIIGIVTMCFASAFYFVADLGVSTYDAVALIITGTWKIGQFRYVRIICDFVCVAVGELVSSFWFLCGVMFPNLIKNEGLKAVLSQESMRLLGLELLSQHSLWDH